MLKVKGNILEGVISVKGSKNASLMILIASLLNKGIVELYNIPLIEDVKVALRVMEYLNCKINITKDKIVIDSSNIKYRSLNIPLVTKIRASYYFIPVLLTHFSKCEFSSVGGCDFSSRPINYHLKGFKKMGIKVDFKEHYMFLGNVKSNYYKIPKVSIGTSVNMILLGVKSNSTLIIDNLAIEPEVIDLINFLKLLGAKIEFIKERMIIIKGVTRLKKLGIYKVMYDRIEAASFLILGALKGRNLVIENFILKDNLALVNLFNKLKVKMNIYDNKVIISKCLLGKIKEVKASYFPFLASDILPILIVYLANLNSKIIVKDLIYPLRNSHLKELEKLNYKFLCNEKKVIILGKGASKESVRVKGEDLRGAFALLVSLINEDRENYLEGEDNILRGYEDIFARLRKIGVEIREI